MNKNGIAVLMYHGIVSDENDISNPIHISKKTFEEQMAWLYENKYRTITLNEMLQFFERKQIPPKCVVLTFDDGYQSLLTNATPVLKSFNLFATLFLMTGAIGEKSYTIFNSQNSSFPENDPPLNWSQLKDMTNACWNIEAHSRNHYIHNIISQDLLEKEMRGSKEDIEYHIHKKVEFYCYPCGSYNTNCLKLLKKLGYKAAFSVHPGLANWNSDLRRLPRVEINQHTNLECFKRKLETGFADSFTKLKSSIKNVAFRNTRVKDAMKYIYDLRK
jgi:peptidoglycan/xylan/chitin deacetylase (PgdA/CDA1 family)